MHCSLSSTDSMIYRICRINTYKYKYKYYIYLNRAGTMDLFVYTPKITNFARGILSHTEYKQGNLCLVPHYG